MSERERKSERGKKRECVFVICMPAPVCVFKAPVFFWGTLDLVRHVRAGTVSDTLTPSCSSHCTAISDPQIQPEAWGDRGVSNALSASRSHPLMSNIPAHGQTAPPLPHTIPSVMEMALKSLRQVTCIASLCLHQATLMGKCIGDA